MDRQDLTLLALAAASLGLAGWLLWRLRGAARARAARRAGYFDAAAELFTGVTRGLAPDGFARLNGQRGGRVFDLQAVPDTLTFRKLPALWVLVSLPGPVPVGATFDLMLRPTGGETFSNFGALRHSVAAPAGFPPGAALRTDDPAGLPDAGLLRPHLAVFADPAVKELVISPRGLRLVILAEEADRTRYLLFRDAEMGAVPLPPARLRPLLEVLAALAADLEAAAGTREHAP